VSVCARHGSSDPQVNSKAAGFPGSARLLRHADFERIQRCLHQGRYEANAFFEFDQAVKGYMTVAQDPKFAGSEHRKEALGLTASLRTWQLRTLVNPLIVGRFVGAEGVAYVALAIRIAEALGSFRLAAGRMAIAALARLQDRRHEFRRALEQALFLQVVTLGPLLCAFALTGPYIVQHFIGARWMPSMQIYPFAAAGVLVMVAGWETTWRRLQESNPRISSCMRCAPSHAKRRNFCPSASNWLR